MVYCVTCGTRNPDSAQACTNCGRQLYTTSTDEHYKRMEDECFGIPHGGIFVGLAIGVIILVWGAIVLLQQADIIPASVSIWPFILIVFGVLILVGALYGMSRRRY